MATLREFNNLEIDWNMTPEDAVTLYLEWGNNSWHSAFQPVRSKSDYSNYFVVYTWDEHPRVILIRRNSEEARELMEIELPNDMAKRFLEEHGHLKGTYPPNAEIKQWLEAQLYN